MMTQRNEAGAQCRGLLHELRCPYQIEAISRRTRLSQCRAGSVERLAPEILPLSLPNAMTEPEKVTAPISIPR